MNIEHILVVIDPTSDADQPCLHRAEQLADQYPQARFTLFLVDYIPALDGGIFNRDSLAKARHTLLGHREERLERYADPLRARGRIVNTTAVWGKRYEHHILRAIHEQQPDLVLKTTHHHNLLKRLVLTNTDWFLIRHCPVPLWLVKQADNAVRAIGVSVDPLHEADKPAALDYKLLATGRALAAATGAQVQTIHCYNPLPHTLAFDTGLVADYDGYAAEVQQHHDQALRAFAVQAGVAANELHLLKGYPEQAIPEFIAQQGIDLLIMGAISRSRLDSALVGHTAERLLDEVPCDVLIVKPDGFVDPSKPA
ncbi:putative universal stress protein [Pseudomonas saudimassiliensis]|uniref:Putative universal stress protein n=1 Tax=Pseudomonas saudimassiliensis TaxID=1461581 RepID=A0A078ML13_9PSED|nr:universal stress protein [Pseudomonas saudimassiliensis]CEA06102.1 putative universal stress protein [Pseudomonas saudimassiliensis]CEF27527.1 putative universal stress protein [Pseudomonas saudimassiliensis]